MGELYVPESQYSYVASAPKPFSVERVSQLLPSSVSPVSELIIEQNKSLQSRRLPRREQSSYPSTAASVHSSKALVFPQSKSKRKMKVQEQPETSNTTTTKPRRGILSRFRRSKNGSSNQTADNREPPKVKSRSKSSKREGTPLEKRSSPQEMLPRSQRKPQSSTRVLDGPPAAENAAFSGPPRYDWIDIVSHSSPAVSSPFLKPIVQSSAKVVWGSFEIFIGSFR